MTRKNLTLNLVILISALVYPLFNTIDAKAGSAKDQPVTQPGSNGFSCAYPTSYDQQMMCRHMEAKILASTIRIEMHADYAFGQSHATVVGGRYLMTHNHFHYSLRDRSGAGYKAVTLRKANGDLLLDKAPLSSFKIVHEDKEALVLEFVDRNGRGLFDALGVPSAQTLDWKSVPWVAGLELAVVDWNRQTAHVDWVGVVAGELGGKVPNVQVNNLTMDGASGSGAFWNGYHVGNVWAWGLERDAQTDQVVRNFTLLALNSEMVGGLD